MELLTRPGVDVASYAEILYAQTQRIGEAVGFLGLEAMLIPNARHASTNLVVFPQNSYLDTLSTASQAGQHGENLAVILDRSA